MVSMIKPTDREEHLLRNHPVEKDDTTAPGDHNDVMKSFLFTQSTERGQKFLRGRVKNFVDDFSKSKKFVPGVGSYFKVADSEIKCIKQLSVSPKELRTYRH